MLLCTISLQSSTAVGLKFPGEFQLDISIFCDCVFSNIVLLNILIWYLALYKNFKELIKTSKINVF